MLYKACIRIWKAALPPEGCLAEAGGLFGPESALGFDRPSGTNARRPSQKAVGYNIWEICLVTFVRMSSNKAEWNLLGVFFFLAGGKFCGGKQQNGMSNIENAGLRIRRLYFLQRGKTAQIYGYGTKRYLMIRIQLYLIWGLWSTPLLPLLKIHSGSRC